MEQEKSYGGLDNARTRFADRHAGFALGTVGAMFLTGAAALEVSATQRPVVRRPRSGTDSPDVSAI